MTEKELRAARAGAVGLVLFAGGCYTLGVSRGGGETEVKPTPAASGSRVVDPADVAVPPGYTVEAVAVGLKMPSGVTFDDAGRVYVVESGYSYGEIFDTPKLIEITRDMRRRVVATGDNPPWTGVTFHQGAFYVAEGGVMKGGRILRITSEGAVTPLVEGLPSLGDHHTNGPVIGPDGMVYFGQGTATNSAVVGEDSAEFGWLKRHPEFHDIPCKDVKLSGLNYVSKNPLTPDPDDTVRTGPFMPFGKEADQGQVIPGAVPCSGAVMKVSTSGGPPELVAWGFRNPFGLAFAPDGRLFVTDNMYDERGSRPVFGTGDYLWAVTEGTWYGWPDYAGGEVISDADRFSPVGMKALPLVLAETPPKPPRPVTQFGVHSSSDGFDFARSPRFGHVGEAFVAQFGDMAPKVGRVAHPVGFKVVRVNVATSIVEDFATNRKGEGPASKGGNGGLERPVAARFDPSGDALYVVDYGILQVGEQGPRARPPTGVLWKITRGTR